MGDNIHLYNTLSIFTIFRCLQIVKTFPFCEWVQLCINRRSDSAMRLKQINHTVCDGIPLMQNGSAADKTWFKYHGSCVRICVKLKK